jgi:hypothetical protein
MRELGAEPRLVVPEGLLIEESVRERMVRELSSAPAEVSGIAAEIAELAPGASYRVHAEWTALETRSAPLPHRGGPVRGAVLVRPDVECSIRDGAVEVASGSVLVDPGAHVHDPHRPNGPLEVASDHGRPPFPRRPVVVFLGCEPFRDPDWLRRLVNRLVRHEVEARLAIPPNPAGEAGSAPAVHLTRPCLPGEATIRALEPDVVVTLDAVAAREVDAWLAGDRSTVVVELDLALPVPMELVSWQIGRASGRRRARIGRWVDVPAFAALVGRLCAGPQPIPPSEAPELRDLRTPVHEHWTRREPARGVDGCVVLTGSLDAHASARVEGLADNLAAEGVPVVVRRVSGRDLPGEARGAALVLLAGLAPAPAVDALIADRRRAGLPTAVDLTPSDVVDDLEVRLALPAAALAEACGLVVAAAGARITAARTAGARVIDLPTLLTRARAAALRDARASIDPSGVLVIGWRIGRNDEPAPAYANAVGEGIATILTEHRDRVEIVGDAERVPPALRGHERVTVVAADAGAETIAGWALHVWTPRLAGGEILDDARLLEEASSAGVASIMPADACSGVDGFVSSHVLVQSVDAPGDWYSALHHVLDDPTVRSIRAHEASRRADALDELAISKAVVSRFLGRVTYRPERSPS